jgi:hypothetical protein
LNEIEEENIDGDISDGEIEDDDIMSSWTEWNESEGSYVWDTDDSQDSSAMPQNDDNLEKIDAPMDSLLSSEWQTSSEDENQIFTITSEDLPFSKMKQLMTIVSWNSWDITIQVLWNEMKVSEKWLNELKKLIQE